MDRAAPQRPILHLDSVKRVVGVCDEIEGRVLGRRKEHDEATIGEIGVNMRNSTITLVLGVMSADDRRTVPGSNSDAPARRATGPDERTLSDSVTANRPP